MVCLITPTRCPHDNVLTGILYEVMYIVHCTCNVLTGIQYEVMYIVHATVSAYAVIYQILTVLIHPRFQHQMRRRYIHVL